MTDPAAFRAEFPVLERLAYLNAGTDGPLPRRSAEAIAARAAVEAERGRGGSFHFEALRERSDALRSRLAALLGAGVDEVALTGSTTDGINTVLAGLELGSGDEVITSADEHPGLLGPLALARRRCGFDLRVVPLGEVAQSAGPSTCLVACSHVSWVDGALAPMEALRELDALVLLDGAQGLGAIPLDMRTLGCDFYAASGQKWLCGPDSTGALYVRSDRIEALGIPWPSYVTLADPANALELEPAEGARRFDSGVLSGPLADGWLASIDLMGEAGWDWVHSRAAGQVERLREMLGGQVELVASGASTLVSWRSGDPGEAVERLAGLGVVVRQLPGRGLLRASVGAWNSDDDLERLTAALAEPS